MKKLEDYLPSKSRRKKPAKVSESPILSPDTTKALENAERLVKEAQKKIIEASYDIDSSPEREKSIGSAREGEAEDEDALYIRDIVSTRFHEANESARIFTRPSARPLAERLCRPEVRRGRARRLGEGANKTRTEQSTIRRSNLRSSSGRTEKNFNAPRLQNSFRPRRAAQDEERPSEIPKPSMTYGYRSPEKVAAQTSINSLKVQEGPRVDIRNALTVTEVENVDISPKPRSSLPVRNIKTYEFRHEFCVKDVVAEASRTIDEGRERETGVSGPTRRSPEVAEESADPLRSGAGPAPARQGSRSDLVGNKSGRSIRPQPLEGHADDARISKRDATEHEENPPESFIDFLRRAASDDAGKLCEDAQKAEALRNKVLGSMNTKEKIDIFDRAIDEFFDEFKREAPKKNSSRSPPRRGEENRLGEENCLGQENRLGEEKRLGKEKRLGEKNRSGQENPLPERDVVDGDRFDDEKLDDFAKEVLEALENEPEVFGDDWNPEDIKLEPPNFEDLEKTVRRFDSTIEKIILDTNNLEVLMSRYCIEAEVPERPEVAFADREPRSSSSSCPAPAQEIPNHEQKKTAHVRRKKAPRCEDYKSTISEDEDPTGSSEESRGIVTAKSGCKASREEKSGRREKKIPGELEESRLRFSTPLGGSRIVASSHRANAANSDFETDEFGRFLIGIERPNCVLERRRIVGDEREVSSARRNEPEENSSRRRKIVLDRMDRNCNFDELFDGDREENSHETATFPTYTPREKRASSDARNSGRSLIQDSAIGGTTDRSEKIFLGAKLIDERVARKDSSRSERSAPARKNYEKSASPTTKILTVKNCLVDVASMADVREIESKKLTDDGRKPRSKGEKNRSAGSVGSSPRDRTSFDVSTAYSDDFEEPAGSSGKSKFEEKIVSRMNDGENSVFEEKKSSAIVDREEEEDGKSVLKKSGEKVESAKSDLQNSMFKEKESSAIVEDRSREVEDGRRVPKEIGEKLESTKSDEQNSIYIEKKSSAMMEDRKREVEDGKSVLKEIGEKLESKKSDGQNSIFKEKKSSAIMGVRDVEVEDGKTVMKKSEEKLESPKSDGQNSIFKEKKSSAMMDDRDGKVEGVAKSGQNSILEEKKSSAIMDVRDVEVEDGKTVLKKTEEKLESAKSGQNSILEEKKSSAIMDDSDEEVGNGKSSLKNTEEKLESTKSDRQNPIFNEKKSSAVMNDRNEEVEGGKSVPQKTEDKTESTNSDRQISIFNEKKSSALMNVQDDKTVRGPRESPEWPMPRGESREETKYPEKSFSDSVNESSDRNKDDDERRHSEVKGSVENNSGKKEADPNSGELSEKSSGYRASVLSSSGSTKASGMSSLLRESHREGIKGPEESNDVDAAEDSVLGKKPIACSRLLCDGVIGRWNCEECTNCPVLDTIEVLEKSSSIDAVEFDSLQHNKEEIERTEPQLEVLESNRLNEAFTEFRDICPTDEDSMNRFDEHSPSNFEQLRPEDDVQKENTQDPRKDEDKKEPEKLERSKSTRTNKIVGLENEAKKSSWVFCEHSDRSNFESRTNFEKIGDFESSAIINSTPEQFVANSGPTIGSLVQPFPDDDYRNIQDLQKREDKKELEKLELQKSSRTNKNVDLENEAKKSSRIFCEHSDRSNFESRTNYEKIGGFESSAIIHSTPKQSIANSGRTMESLVLPFPDPIPDDDLIERAGDACSENYSEGELYLPSSCSYSLGEIRISERPSYGTVGTGIESSTRNSDGIRIFFTKSYTTPGSSDHTINAPNTTVQSPGEVQETDVESIGSSRGLSSSGEHRQGS